MAVLWPQVQPAGQPESQQPGQRLYAHLLAVPGLCAPGEAVFPSKDVECVTVQQWSKLHRDEVLRCPILSPFPATGAPYSRAHSHTPHFPSFILSL